MRATLVAGQRVDADEDQYALDRSIDNAKRQRLRVVLVPGLYVEGEEAGKKCRNRVPALAHVLRRSEDEDLERRVESIDAMVKEFTEGSGLVGAASETRGVSHMGSFHYPSRRRGAYACEPSTASNV